MVSQRLFIIWSHPLFREFVNRLLDDPAIAMVGAASEYKAALGELESLKPDTIIVEETQDCAVTSVEAVEILKVCTWGPRVIRLSLQDNELWVYHQERWNVGSKEDFLRLVRDT
jgi:DNA-binding NarL/FixJ family response regulator